MASTRTGRGAQQETERLEQLWAGKFGDEYVDSSIATSDGRGEFWLPLMQQLQPETVLEIGCSVGPNLQWIAQELTPTRIVGVDVNAKALRLLEERVPGVRAVHAPARELPLADRSIDFVFTFGVLMHQPEASLEKVMSEMVRVARRYLLCGEYYNTETVEVHHRGVEGALFRRDYGSLFEEYFPIELIPIRQGYLSPGGGWDRVAWWLFQRV
jgi:pseudaminic acid biosynthesis-associated methylase